MSEKKKILTVFLALNIGGDETRLLNFARSVDRSKFDHKVLVLCPPAKDADDRAGPMLREYEKYGIEVDDLGEQTRTDVRGSKSRLAMVWHDISTSIRIVRKLYRYLRANPVDVLDLRMALSIVYGTIAGRLAGVPVIAGTAYFTNDWPGPVFATLGQLIVPQLDVLICDSWKKLDLYRDWLIMKAPRREMIQNGIIEMNSPRTKQEMRRELGLPEDLDITIIGQIARAVPEKGQLVLLDAAERILAEEENVWFLVCGYSQGFPEYREQLLKKIDQVGRGRIVLTSYPGPVQDAWRAVDIHAHPSSFDSSPITVHEGMSLGLPVVTSNVGGMHELVLDGETGFVVPMEDSEALADKLRQYLHDPELRERMGAAARKRYEERHRPEIMTRKIEDLFSELLAEAEQK